MQHERIADTSVRAVSKMELFLGFMKIGVLGFGGVAPWARHIIVEERAWLNEREFAAVLGIAQILPGPNTMNAAVIIGNQFQGAAGAVLCVLGQLLLPLVIVTSLGVVYQHFAAIPEVNAALIGAAAGAAGLVMGTAIKMAQKIRLTPLALLVSAAAFCGVELLQWPLVPVVVIAVPLGVLAAVLERRA